MVAVDIGALIILFIPFYLIYLFLKNKAREKATLGEFLQSGKTTCWITIGVVAFITELWLPLLIVFVIGQLMGKNGNPVKDWFEKTMTNWLTDIWNKVRPGVLSKTTP